MTQYPYPYPDIRDTIEFVRYIDYVENECDYPESDGLPMTDNMFQFLWIVLIKENLEAMLIHVADVLVAGNLLWYPVRYRNDIRRGPDIMVVFGRPKGLRRSYLQWKEGNIPPQVVFEILSPGNTRIEMRTKFAFYQQYGVEEYYIYDPYRNQLQGWLRRGALLHEIQPMHGWVSPRLHIRFDMQPNTLVIYRPDGTRFLSHTEIEQQAKQERRRATKEYRRAVRAEQQTEAERQRAEAERQRAARAERQAKEERRRADEERQRVAQAEQQAEKERQQAAQAKQQAEEERQHKERLAAILREMGIDPDKQG